PVIELIHGFPGVPQAWITVLGVNGTLRNLIGAGLAKPAVLVMPDASGGLGHRGLLGRRILRGEPWLAVPPQLRLLRSAERLLQAIAQSARARRGQPLWR